MDIYAVIKDNLVQNLVRWDGTSPYDPGEGYILVLNPNAFIGQEYIDGQFIYLPPPLDPSSQLDNLLDG